LQLALVRFPLSSQGERTAMLYGLWRASTIGAKSSSGQTGGHKPKNPSPRRPPPPRYPFEPPPMMIPPPPSGHVMEVWEKKKTGTLSSGGPGHCATPVPKFKHPESENYIMRRSLPTTNGDGPPTKTQVAPPPPRVIYRYPSPINQTLHFSKSEIESGPQLRPPQRCERG